MDDVDRMYRHLVRTIRATSPQLLAQPFQVGELYSTILPYRLHRRELGLETNQDYEMAMLELLSGGRGYLAVQAAKEQSSSDGARTSRFDEWLEAQRVRKRVMVEPAPFPVGRPFAPMRPLPRASTTSH